MKTSNLKFVFALLSILLLTLPACQVDECENQACLNGGSCVDGSCICTNGFSGEHCEIAPTRPDCEVNNTAGLCLTNSSTTNKTYDIVLDGVLIMTLAPGQTECEIVAAGQHTISFYFTNTSTKACLTSYPILPQCSTKSYNCSK